MAKLIEQTFVVTVSKLARNTDGERVLLTPEHLTEIAGVIETMVGEGAMTEIEQVK